MFGLCALPLFTKLCDWIQMQLSCNFHFYKFKTAVGANSKKTQSKIYVIRFHVFAYQFAHNSGHAIGHWLFKIIIIIIISQMLRQSCWNSHGPKPYIFWLLCCKIFNDTKTNNELWTRNLRYINITFNVYRQFHTQIFSFWLVGFFFVVVVVIENDLFASCNQKNSNGKLFVISIAIKKKTEKTHKYSNRKQNENVTWITYRYSLMRCMLK